MPTVTGQQSPLRDPNLRESYLKGPTKVETTKTVYEEPLKTTHIEQIKKIKEVIEPGKTIVEKVPTEVYEGRSPVTIERQQSGARGQVDVYREGIPQETTRIERERILHVDPVRRVEVEDIKKEQWEEERGRPVQQPVPRMQHSPTKFDPSLLQQVEHGLQQTHLSGEQTNVQRENLGLSSAQGGLPQQTSGFQSTGMRGQQTEWRGESSQWKGEQSGLERSAPTTTGGYVPVTYTPHGYPPTGYGENQRFSSQELPGQTSRPTEGAYMGGTTGTSSQWTQPTGQTWSQPTGQTWSQPTGQTWSQSTGQPTSGYTGATTGTSGYCNEPGHLNQKLKKEQGWKQQVHSSLSEQPHLHPPGTVPKQTTKQKLRGITSKLKGKASKGQ